jgi:hypothetical protein
MPGRFKATNTLVFLEENQGVVVWGVSLTPAPGDDPPVLQGNGAPLEWYPEHPTCAEFLEVMLHWQAVMGEAFAACGFAQLDKAPRRALDEHCLFVGEVNQLRAYNRDGVALCLVPWDPGTRLFVAGPTPAIARNTVARVGLHWDDHFEEV